MPEYLRAFIVVITLTVTVFVVIQRPAIGIIGPETFRRWRAAWVSLTVATFLIPGFWLFLATATVIVLVVAAREPARPALYLLLVFTTPPITQSIPGFAGINRFFDIGWYQLLALLLLLPAVMTRGRTSRQKQAPRLPDVLFFLYFALFVVLTLRGTTFTDTMRTGFVVFLGMVLPYVVFSRWPRSGGDLRLLAAAFVLPLAVLAVIGIFEMLWGWHVYAAIGYGWGRHMGYVFRVEGLRAYASVLGPIQFGYVFMVGGGLLLLALGSRPRPRLRVTALAWMGAGLISSLSRGPMVGAAVLALAFLSTGRGAFLNLVKLGLAGLVILMVAMPTPLGDRLIGMVPYVGDVDTGTIDYREQLYDNSMIVIQRNPLLGSVNYRDAPEMQELIYFGMGTVDVVNTYLAVTLETGLIGLTLFCGFFFSVLFGLWRAVKALPDEEADLKWAGRALLATLAAILVTIATVSSVGPIPLLYWTVAGLCVAQTGIIRRRLGEIEEQAINSRPRRSTLVPPDPVPLSPVRARPAPASAVRPGSVGLKTNRRSGK